ncbi:MAG: hypothetical protein QW228_01420 [Candidatus Aenigmatarchaeota archaeon]
MNVLLQNIAKTTEAELELPRDQIDAWAAIILDYFSRKYPELSRYPATIVFYNINAEKGMALGTIDVVNENNLIQIPVLIKKFILLPLDLFIHHGNVYPLDPALAIKILEGIKIFEGLTAIPRPRDEAAYSLEKTRFLNKYAWSYTRTQLANLRKLFDAHKKEYTELYNTYDHFKKIADFINTYEPPPSKIDVINSDLRIDRDIIQIKQTEDPLLFKVRLNSSHVWHPTETIVDIEGIKKIADRIGLPPEFIEFVKKHNSVTLNLNKFAIEKAAVQKEIEFTPALQAGDYVTYLFDKNAFIQGAIREKINPPGWLFINGKYYAETDKMHPFMICGTTRLKSFSQSPITSDAFGYFIDDKIAVGPFYILAISFESPRESPDISQIALRPTTIHARTPDNKLVKIILNSGVNRIIITKDSDIPSGLTIEISKHQKPCSTIYLPSDFIFVETKYRINIPVKDQIDQILSICTIKSITIKFNPVSQKFELLGNNLPRILKSASVSKIGEPITFDLQNLNFEDALFILSTKYLPKEASNILKQAILRGKITLEDFSLPINLSEIQQKSKELAHKYANKFSVLQLPWEIIKAAAETDEESLDAVFSLGLANPENFISIFQDIPIYEQLVSRLAKLLLFARLGAINLNPHNLKMLIEYLQDVIRRLKQLKFDLMSISQ